MVISGGLHGGQYQPLSQEQISQIHKATLEVLSNTGVEISNKQPRNCWRTPVPELKRNETVFICPLNS